MHGCVWVKPSCSDIPSSVIVEYCNFTCFNCLGKSDLLHKVSAICLKLFLSRLCKLSVPKVIKATVVSCQLCTIYFPQEICYTLEMVLYLGMLTMSGPMGPFQPVPHKCT